MLARLAKGKESQSSLKSRKKLYTQYILNTLQDSSYFIHIVSPYDYMCWTAVGKYQNVHTVRRKRV